MPPHADRGAVGLVAFEDCLETVGVVQALGHMLTERNAAT
jgi:hypothetical protein